MNSYSMSIQMLKHLINQGGFQHLFFTFRLNMKFKREIHAQ